MRCPKCHYLSFEPEARCRNCGYDLELAEDDLLIKAADDDDDLELQDFDLRADSGVTSAPIALGRMHAVDDPPIAPSRYESSTAVAVAPPPVEVASPIASPPAAARGIRPPSTTTELPLFMRATVTEVDPDAPLVPMTSSPRPPLAVRRSTDGSPEPVRRDRTSINDVNANLESVWAPLPASVSSRLEGDTDGLDEMDEADEAHHAPARERDMDVRAIPIARASKPAVSDDGSVSVRERVTADAIDLAVLGAIDIVVVWLTVRICALTFGDVLTLPLAPLVIFFLLVDAGYLLLFTATSGQTLGKMAAHIRVVGTDDADGAPLSLRQAAVRSFAALPSVLAFGAGLLPAFAGHGDAVHDRLAHTRVVRA